MFNLLSIGSTVGFTLLIVLLVVVMGLIIFFLADLVVAVFTRGKGKETAQEVYSEPVKVCEPVVVQQNTAVVADENFFGELEPKKEQLPVNTTVIDVKEN